MSQDILHLPGTSPERIISLRECAFAVDLFITAVSHFDFFNWLAKAPANINTICRELNIQPRPADVMLTLFKAYGFIEQKDGMFFLANVAKDYLTKESGFDLSSYVSSLKNRPIAEDMKNVLLTGKPANWAAAKDGKDWAASMADDAFAASFTAGMNSRGAYLANGVLKALDFKKHKKLLDIGGASGIYASVICKKYPHLQAAVFEKPPVDKVAAYSISKFGLSDRICVEAGDMFKDSLPQGYDVHFLSHVLHDWDFPAVETVLKNSYQNLAPGGIIVIHDAHINADKTGPLSVAEYSVLLMSLSEGKCYSVTEMKDALEKAGFKWVGQKPTILDRSIVIGRK
jgi:3-hydroxy-5-methyl-1-naphthoate 3-O-methyltransferase